MLLDEAHESKRLQVLGRQDDVHMCSASVPPRPVAVERRASSTFSIESQSLEFSESRAWSLPLPPYDTAQLSTYPPIEFLEDSLDLRQAEVCNPTPDDRLEFPYDGS